MMKKTHAFLYVLLLAPFIAGIYGILHDQITYSISPEYYTEFKFIQFGLSDEKYPTLVPHWLLVCVVGFLATWWMGPPIALFLLLVGLKNPTAKGMFITAIRAIVVTMITAMITGIFGLMYGLFSIPDTTYWYIPENLIDKSSFIAVGSMHNFSYLGGLLGMILGIFYTLRTVKKVKGQNH